MLFKITVTVPTQMQLKQAAQRAQLKQVRAKMRGIRCPEHGVIPRAVIRAGRVEIGGLCCDTLREQVNRAIGK